jgi:hypothetical protein
VRFAWRVKLWPGIPGIELMPTSMTTAPGLIHEPLTNSACPIATTRISACFIWVCGEKSPIDGKKSTHELLEVLGAAVTLGDGRVLVPQEGDDGVSDDVASTKHEGVGT